MNLNFKQMLAILIAALAVLSISSANLTDLFGAHAAKIIVSTANLLNTMLGSVLAVVTGQAAMVKDVAAMPGVETIKVNAQANPTLARIAVDPDQEKVEATPQAQAQVNETAQQ